MGVKISDLIEKKRLTFEDLAQKKVAVDFSNAAYQFLSSIRQRDGTPLMDLNGNVTSHLQGILSRSSNLLSQGIKIAYVFDGIPPALKKSTQEKRQELKRRAEGKYESAKEEGDEEMMLRYSKQFIRLTPKMSDESKELIEAMGIPLIQAPAEADAQIAHCARVGDVWAASTTDVDPLLHACPRIITNLTLSQRKRTPVGIMVKVFPELVELDKVLEAQQLSREQLISLSLLVGTDYNDGIKGIGPKKALKIVKELQEPKKIFKEHPLDDVNWEEAFDLFVNMDINEQYDLHWNEPDEERVLKLLVDKHGFTEQRVLAALTKITGRESKKETGQQGLSGWM